MCKLLHTLIRVAFPLLFSARRDKKCHFYVAENTTDRFECEFYLIDSADDGMAGYLHSLRKIMHLLFKSANAGVVCSRMPKLKRLRIFNAVVIAALMLLQRLVSAQAFVDAPEPKLSSAAARPALIHPTANPTHQFFDHQNIIAFSAAAALRSADSAYTCAVGVGTTTHNADGSITVRREDSLPVNSCHGVVLMNAAFTGTGLGGSYLMHKLGWHKLERLPNWIVASVPVLGIAYTATHQNGHASVLPAK